MLLRRLKLVNYGGIYNGMGLYEIEIDFSKCKNKIILIKGDNGTGKSTIENALKPLPDDNSSFISGKDASKTIEYIDEVTFTIYSITFIHEYKNSSRTTKGFFKKIINGNIIEMNPSGNITSCKDIIYEELQLDPNYITLTQLSNTKRGIADLRPADRKRYVNAILSNTDVYNNMYKKLSKKASTYKSMMSSIVSKLDSIGNIVQLQQSISAIENKISDAENMIEQYTEVMNKEKGMLHSIDKDNKISEQIERLDSAMKEYTSKKSNIESNLKKIYSKYPNLTTTEITTTYLDKMNSDLFDITNRISSLKSRAGVLLESRQVDADELQAKTTKLKSINSNESLYEIKQIKSKMSSRKKEIEDRWGSIIDLNNITIDEFMLAYDAIQNMRELSNINIIPENQINTEYLNITKQVQDIDNEIESIINDRNIIDAAEDKISILKQRPSSCNIDNCPFISDALKAKSIINNMKEHVHTLKELNLEKDLLQDKLNTIDMNKQLVSIYKSNSRILRKINLGLDTYDNCINTIKYNIGNIITTLNGIIEYVNDLEEYKKINKNLIDIESKYHSLSTQEDFISMINEDINRLQNQLDKDTEEINNINNNIQKLQQIYDEISITLQVSTSIFDYHISLNECNDAIKILNEELDENRSNIDKIQKLKSDIEKIEINISELREQLKPLKKERDTLEYKLNISNEYNKELKEYNDMYTKVDTLKYYCSPTTGIQLLFANMYLSKIMDNANNILRNLFGGVFALLPLVITETEFKIPVAVNGGINHDDITSMSSAQISLISMIISISLLSQTSTKLNIIIGDEIDAPFDSENRREFINILMQLMNLVKSSQCVLISHNSEIPMVDCDIILLKNDNDIISEGNIIWSYK